MARIIWECTCCMPSVRFNSQKACESHEMILVEKQLNKGENQKKFISKLNLLKPFFIHEERTRDAYLIRPTPMKTYILDTVTTYIRATGINLTYEQILAKFKTKEIHSGSLSKELFLKRIPRIITGAKHEVDRCEKLVQEAREHAEIVSMVYDHLSDIDE